MQTLQLAYRTYQQSNLKSISIIVYQYIYIILIDTIEKKEERVYLVELKTTKSTFSSSISKAKAKGIIKKEPIIYNSYIKKATSIIKIIKDKEREVVRDLKKDSKVSSKGKKYTIPKEDANKELASKKPNTRKTTTKKGITKLKKAPLFSKVVDISLEAKDNTNSNARGESKAIANKDTKFKVLTTLEQEDETLVTTYYTSTYLSFLRTNIETLPLSSKCCFQI